MPRLLRAALVTGLVVLLGGGAHASAGGAAPTPFVAALLTALGLPVAWWATGRRLGRGGLFTVLAGGQAAVHGALVAMHPTHAAAPGLTEAGAGGHTHAHAATLPDLAALAAPAAPHQLTPAMLAGHLVATLVAVWLVSRGEAMIEAALDLLLPHLTGAHRPTTWATPPVARLAAPCLAPVLGGLGARAPPVA